MGHKFSVSTFWAQIRLTHSNTIQYVGETCRYLVEAPENDDSRYCYGKVKLAYGNGLRMDIWTKFKKKFGIPAIGEFYASSESPFATTCHEVDGNGVGAIRNNGWMADRSSQLPELPHEAGWVPRDCDHRTVEIDAESSPAMDRP